ncbi:MAG TPA: glycosyltransferase family A protein [Verrucomicrobiae bacterium]|nr:glycosyltransferase family A protein [Verrucomicrobiae bacterium]
MKPLVSILIPAYNAQAWIQSTLDSALNQDYPNIEVILVNDGSTDQTLAIAKRFESKSVKIVDQPNAGGPAARNVALTHSQGDYIQWLDHDDLLDRHKINEQLKAIAYATVGRILLSGAFGKFFYCTERAVFSPTSLWRDLTPREYFFAKFNDDKWLQTSAWLVSRKLAQMAGPWWEIRSPDDDGEYFCRVVACSEKIEFVATAKSYWRVGNHHSFTHSRARSTAALESLLASTMRCIQHFRSTEDSEESRAACVSFLRHRLIHFYPDHPKLLERMYRRANELGGSLSAPPLRRPYDLIRSCFGWRVARAANVSVPWCRTMLFRNWDKLIYKCFACSVR